MTISHIAVLSSGGDAPGMNCAIRAIVRTALFKGIKVSGVRRGYSGLVKGDFREMNHSSVGNILQRGGTILQTSRSPEFMEKKFREVAYNNLKNQGIDALIVIGGDGSFNGAKNFGEEFNFPVIGIPGTIDNDISGTEYTIGFETAVQTAIDAVDRIRDTAHSHARTFLVEVMGRNSSAIALKVGVCTGAENVLLPHEEVDYQRIIDDVNRGVARGKESSIIIVAEGPKSGRSYEIRKNLKEQYKLDAHVAILGHIQRGGSPVANDRFIASEMGNLAVNALIEGKTAHVTVVRNGKTMIAPISECVTKQDLNFTEYKKLAQTLSI